MGEKLEDMLITENTDLNDDSIIQTDASDNADNTLGDNTSQIPLTTFRDTGDSTEC